MTHEETEVVRRPTTPAQVPGAYLLVEELTEERDEARAREAAAETHRARAEAYGRELLGKLTRYKALVMIQALAILVGTISFVATTLHLEGEIKSIRDDQARIRIELSDLEDHTREQLTRIWTFEGQLLGKVNDVIRVVREVEPECGL